MTRNKADIFNIPQCIIVYHALKPECMLVYDAHQCIIHPQCILVYHAHPLTKVSIFFSLHFQVEGEREAGVSDQRLHV